MSTRERPLSPHLQIYKPQITSMTSITHRATGLAMTGGLALLTWWLVATASGGDAYEQFQSIATSWFGQVVILGFIWSFFYHLCNGIRHIAWDFGYGLELDDAERSGWTVVIGSIALTGLTVFVAMMS